MVATEGCMGQTCLVGTFLSIYKLAYMARLSEQLNKGNSFIPISFEQLDAFKQFLVECHFSQ